MEHKISVIIPVYNMGSHITGTIDAVRAQTHKDLEIIAVDDGSTDDSGAVLDALAQQEPRLRVLHQENRGVTAARLAGVAAARGTWIGLVDGDDLIEPDMYARLLENALRHGADISHCGYRMVFPDGRVNWFHNTGRLAQQDKLTGLKDLLDGSIIEPGLWNKLFHNSLLHSLFHSGEMDPSIRINEDLLMNALLFARADRSVFEDVCPYHYRIRETSASRSRLSMARIWDPIRVRREIMKMDIPGLEKAAEAAYLSTCIQIYNTLMVEKNSGFRTEEAKVRALIKENRRHIGLLRKKQRLLAYLILCVPFCYRGLYRFYAGHLQKSRYL